MRSRFNPVVDFELHSKKKRGCLTCTCVFSFVYLVWFLFCMLTYRKLHWEIRHLIFQVSFLPPIQDVIKIRTELLRLRSLTLPEIRMTEWSKWWVFFHFSTFLNDLCNIHSFGWCSSPRVTQELSCIRGTYLSEQLKPGVKLWDFNSSPQKHRALSTAARYTTYASLKNVCICALTSSLRLNERTLFQDERQWV